MPALNSRVKKGTTPHTLDFRHPYTNKCTFYHVLNSLAQWPSGLRRESAADRLLGLRVRIPPGAWMFVRFACCVLLGRCLCDGPIPRSEESDRLWCVTVCGLHTSRMRRPWPAVGCCAKEKKKNSTIKSVNFIVKHLNLWDINQFIFWRR